MRYPPNPDPPVSVEAPQLMRTDVEVNAVATTLVGTEGGVVSWGVVADAVFDAADTFPSPSNARTT